jgi:glyoxylase-like metal-dependent hydrolase (beta-lactamase superfamily II)
MVERQQAVNRDPALGRAAITKIEHLERTVDMKKLPPCVLAAACLCVCGYFLPTPVSGEAPMVRSQAPGFHRLMVGDFEVTALSDGTNPMPAMKLLHGNPARIAEALQRNFLREQVETSHNSFLVNTGTKLVLIDAGAGTLLGPHTGDLLNNLRAAGYRPEQVDEIYLTHMHVDHIGGLIVDGQRAFPNAIVRVDKRDAELIPGVRAQSAYGHTPGHTMYVVESRGEKLVLWGDIVHVAAAQCADPYVTIAYDVTPREAAHTREIVFADAAKNRCLIGGAHVSFPGLGHVRSDGGKTYTFVPQTYSALK